MEPLDDGRLRLTYAPDQNPAEALAVRAALGGWGLYELSPERVSLEQIFVELTCREA
ncbi:MAG: ABC transporter ATP-binding protein, partial [Chloroflexi bacterium]|nr:ABC transporter ATP-binding protein [Chloroflexota bacterium]